MKNLISQGLRLGQKVSKGFRKWLKDKMGKCVNCAKSLMQIFVESAESAKSAKPNFALNGVGDGSLWVAEYLTINERISN